MQQRLKRIPITLALIAAFVVTPILKTWPVVPLRAAAAFVQECNNTAGAVATIDCSSWSVGNVTSGNFIVVGAGTRSDPAVSVSSVTKQAGTATIGTAIEIDDLTSVGTFHGLGTYCLPVTGTGTLTLRATFSGTASAAAAINAAEYSGLDSAGCDSTTIDGHNITGHVSCDDADSSGNITTGNNNSMVVGFLVAWGDTATAGTGYTLRSTQAATLASYIEDKILVSAGTTDATFNITTTGAACVIAIMGLKEAAAGGGATCTGAMLRGLVGC